MFTTIFWVLSFASVVTGVLFDYIIKYLQKRPRKVRNGKKTKNKKETNKKDGGKKEKNITEIEVKYVYRDNQDLEFMAKQFDMISNLLTDYEYKLNETNTRIDDLIKGVSHEMDQLKTCVIDLFNVVSGVSGGMSEDSGELDLMDFSYHDDHREGEMEEEDLEEGEEMDYDMEYDNMEYEKEIEEAFEGI